MASEFYTPANVGALAELLIEDAQQAGRELELPEAMVLTRGLGVGAFELAAAMRLVNQWCHDQGWRLKPNSLRHVRPVANEGPDAR